MAKAKEKITAEFFKAHTGRAPIQDDLERCNCDVAGEIGHSCCGWNYRVNKPMFENDIEDGVRITVKVAGSGVGFTYSKETELDKALAYKAELENQGFTVEFIED